MIIILHTYRRPNLDDDKEAFTLEAARWSTVEFGVDVVSWGDILSAETCDSSECLARPIVSVASEGRKIAQAAGCQSWVRDRCDRFAFVKEGFNEIRDMIRDSRRAGP